MDNSFSRPRKIDYRPDIDGLRAVAVLLVVCEHLRLGFRGGYIGVDVFFVISGYLISSIILSDMAEGRFSIASFYERRIRRIFPALFVMMGIVAFFAYRFLVPSETVNFAQSMLAATFSVSNVLFAHQAGYFDQPSQFKPLLHTWSLAVEEQFYILFPIFLVTVRRLARRFLKNAILSLAIISFSAACFWVQHDPTTAFYSAPLRAWELLIGTILSQRYLPSITGKFWRNLLSLSGVALIVVPSLLYSASTPFPGLAAIPPCLGAALIIAADETGPSLVGRLLGTRPVVFLGLISYSLYLWHWPILVFQNTNSMLVVAHAGGRRVKVAILAMSVVVAILSWRFVETPFRKGRLRLARGPLFYVAGGVVAAMTTVGLLMIGSGGFPGRFPPDALAVSRYTDFDTSAAYRVNTCFLQTRVDFSSFRQDICMKQDPNRKNYLLIGDSHSAALYYGLSTEFPEINFLQATVAACDPFIPSISDLEHQNCKQMADFIFDDYLVHHKVDAVVISGRWEENAIPKLQKTLKWLIGHGQHVILIGPVTEYDASLPRILATGLRERDPTLAAEHSMLPILRALDTELGVAARNTWKVRYISIFEDLCTSTTTAEIPNNRVAGCPLYAAPLVPLLIDTDHLSPQGSLLFATAMRARKQLP